LRFNRAIEAQMFSVPFSGFTRLLPAIRNLRRRTSPDTEVAMTNQRSDNSDVCQVLETLMRYEDARQGSAGNDSAPEELQAFVADHAHQPDALEALRRELGAHAGRAA
jgi:hypothetical protein